MIDNNAINIVKYLSKLNQLTSLNLDLYFFKKQGN